MLYIIVSVSMNKRIIGVDNKLPWRISADLKYFKQKTIGNTVIMGRKTYDSIGKALPNRRNIVVSSNLKLNIDGCEVVDSIDKAISLTNKDEEVFIIGGANIYSQTINKADKIFLTEVSYPENKEGDAFFPNIDMDVWEEESREYFTKDEKNEYDYSFVVLKRKN